MKRKQTKPELRLVPLVFTLMILITVSFVLVDTGVITGMVTSTPPSQSIDPPAEIIISYTDTDIENVPDLTISGTGAIDVVFSETVNLSGVNESDILNNIEVGADYFYLDPAALPQLQNKRAYIRFYYNEDLYPHIQFVAIPLPTVDGEICTDCTNPINDGGNLRYDITHFSNYSYTPATALNISDTSDSSTVYSGENLTFYAYYTNVSDGSHITHATCSLTIESEFETPTQVTMDEEVDHYEYVLTTQSANVGNWDFTVECSSDDFDTITLTDDYTIELAPVTFECGETIAQSGSLDSDLTCSGNALTVTADDIILDCDGHSITATGGTAITLNGADNVEVRNCVILNSDQGIALSNSDGFYLHDNIINDTTYGVRETSLLDSSGQGEIKYNTISNSDMAIDLSCSGSDTEIMYNSIENVAIEGITLDFDASRDCSFGTGFVVAENNITGTTSAGEKYGIHLKGVGSSTVENNRIKNFVSTDNYSAGLFVEESYSSNLIEENLFNSSNTGALISSNTESLTIINNDFVDSYIENLLMVSSDDVTISNNFFTGSDYNLEIYSSTNFRAYYNDFSDAQYSSLYLEDVGEVEIASNNISGSGNAGLASDEFELWLYGNISGIEIYDNIFTMNNGAGVYYDYGDPAFNDVVSNVQIRQNEFYSDGTEDGVQITSSVGTENLDFIIYDNYIENVNHGINLDRVNSVEMYDNYITSANTALLLDSADSNNFYDNWFCSNIDDINTTTSTSLTGDNNSCSMSETWTDASSSAGCRYQCAICSLVVTKGVRMGQDLSCADDGLYVGADDVIIDCNGYTIDGDGGTGSWASPDYGIAPTFGVGSHDNAEIKNCVVQEFDMGVGFSDSDIDGLWVHDSDFIDNTLSGIVITTGLNAIIEDSYFSGQLSDEMGIALVTGSNNAIVRNNEFYSLTYPIQTDGAGTAEIYGNTIDSSGIPIYLYDSSNNEVYDNVGTNSYMGVFIEEVSDNNVIRDNSFTGLGVYPDAMGLNAKQGLRVNNSDNNTLYNNVLIDFDDHAIQLIDSFDINITNNTIQSTIGNGIYLDNSDNCILNDNTLETNGKGIRTLSSDNLIITNNYFYDNDGQSFYINIGDNLLFEDNIIEQTGGGYGLWDVTNSNITGEIINSTDPYPGFAMYRSHGNLFENIYQRDAQQVSTAGQDGIYVQSSQNNTFINVTSVENGHHSLIFSVQAGSGLDSSGNQFIDCDFSDNGYRGVVFALIGTGGDENVVNNSIINSTISNNNDYGILYYSNDEGGYHGTRIIGNTFEGNGAEDIYMIGTNMVISGNTMFDGYYSGDSSIYLTDANGTIVEDNDISGREYGVMVTFDSANMEITNNIISNTNYGIAIQGTFDESTPGQDVENMIISGNNIEADSFGIIAQYMQTPTMEHNEIYNAEYGISLDTIEYADINNNFLEGNDYGMDLSVDYSNISYNNMTSVYDDLILTSANHNKLFNNIDAPYEEIIAEDNRGFVLINSYSNEIYNNILSNHHGGDATPTPGYVGDYYGGDAYGLYLENSHSNLIYSNEVDNNTGGEASDEPGVGYGVYLKSSNENYLYDNTLEYNEYAMYIDAGSNNDFEDNFMRFNDYGIYFDTTQWGNVLGNVMCRNQDYDIFVISSTGTDGTDNYCDNSSGWNDTSAGCDNRIFHADRDTIFPAGMELNPDVPNPAIANYDYEFDILYDGTGWTDYSVQVANDFGDFVNLTPESSTFDETTGDTTYHFKVSDEDADYKVIRVLAQNPCYNETHIYGKYKLELKKTGTGVNLISLPVEVDRTEIDGEKEETTTLSTIEAEDFGQRYMASSGLPWLDYVSEWIPSLQQYGGHPVGFDSVSPMTMESGKPYFVSVREDTNITLYGWAPAKQEVDIQAYPTYERTSYNFITLPIDTELETAADLCEDLNNRGLITPSTTYLYIWDEVEQDYIKLSEFTCSQIQTGFDNPSLTPGKTYRFTASTEGTWLQK